MQRIAMYDWNLNKDDKNEHVPRWLNYAWNGIGDW